MPKIKNDLETAVHEEFARLAPSPRSPSQTVTAIKSGVSSAMSRLAQSSFFSSKLPVDKLSKMTSGLLSEKKRRFCHCLVCRTDTLALVLTSLPPCYCRAEHFGFADQKVARGALEKALRTAIRKVTMRPKHPERGVFTDASGVKLVDFGLNLGSRVVPQLIEKTPAACRCELCRLDTLAYGLNQTHSRYGVSIQGKLRIPPSALEFMRHELAKTFAAAAKKIATNPRHDGKEGL